MGEDAGLTREAFEAYLQEPAFAQLPFDLHAQDPGAWRSLAERIPGLVVSSAGGSVVLYQAEGLLQGLPFYFRQGEGSASLQVGQAEKDALQDYLFHAVMEAPEVCDAQSFEEALLKLVPKLATAPFLYEFPVYRKHYQLNGVVIAKLDDDVRSSWGYSARTAFEAIKDFSFPEELEALGLTRAAWASETSDLFVLPEPLRQDDRVFPYEMPHFHVL